MNFRTEYRPAISSLELDPQRPALLLGSCFADNVGRRMRRSLWDATVNPCGTLFNPLSMAAAVGFALGDAVPSAPWPDADGIWRSWDFPTQFADTSVEGCREKCLRAVDALREALTRSRLLVATFGTSIIYTLASQPGRVVANCHKQPARLFETRRVPAAETARIWISLIERIREVNPDLDVVITVSPVRHVKDGFARNARSKAELLLAAEMIEGATERCAYFPAFEIMTDDLRDYRFYAADMVHPSAEAEEYIFEKFCETFIPEAGRRLLREGVALARLCAHRPLLAGSAPAVAHARLAAEAVARWRTEHPGMLTPETTDIYD